MGVSAFENPETNVKWFRRLWFFLLAFQFVSEETWRFVDWFASVKVCSRLLRPLQSVTFVCRPLFARLLSSQRIASNTPVLIVKGKQKQKYLGDEIDYDVTRMVFVL
jgi:hypothetical protein